VDRRQFVGRSAGLLGATAIGPTLTNAATAVAQGTDPIASLRPLGPPVMPIMDEERRARIDKARRLMSENGIGAIFLEGGTSMFYYTGVRWGNSERTFGVVIPAKGELAWVTPAFEEQRARELINFSNDVRVWQEDESP
jgi:Xaa-Pro dipeptidase